MIELMVGMTILIIVFGGSFAVLNKVRTTAKAQDTSGPHLFFETFASSRLRLFFSKLMQWVAHVGAADCSDAHLYAYASNNSSIQRTPLAGVPNNAILNSRTLGADMRMALSTLRYEAVDTETFQNRFQDNAGLWGALVPFTTREVAPGALSEANRSLDSYCARDNVAGGLGDSDGTAREFCNWVETCSKQRARRNPLRALNPDLTDDGIPYLTIPAGEDSKAVSSLNGREAFRMCFAFAGNLFSRTGNVVTTPVDPELQVIDNPSLVGLAVATATFRNTDTGARMTCNQAVNEMNRTLNVRLMLYTVLNSDRTVASKKQLVFKTLKEFSSEKIGAAVPNCAQVPPMPVNGGRAVCIGAPAWLYQCTHTDALFGNCAAPP